MELSELLHREMFRISWHVGTKAFTRDLMTNLVAKYDGLAEGFARAAYANLHFYMHRRFVIATKWGTALEPGDSLLEFGCGDGFLAQLFAEYGLRYRGVDLSPKMVAVAERRLRAAGLEADFVVTDVNQVSMSEPFDAAIAHMRTFFSYVSNPLEVLKRVRPYLRKKLIIDLNPRRDISLAEGLAMVREAGFRRVTWRPFFVPQKKRLPAWLLTALVSCEEIPLVRTVPLRWKFHCLLKGEP